MIALVKIVFVFGLAFAYSRLAAQPFLRDTKHFTEKAFAAEFLKMPHNAENLERVQQFINTNFPDSFSHVFQKIRYDAANTRFTLYQVPLFDKKRRQDADRSVLYTFVHRHTKTILQRIDTLWRRIDYHPGQQDKDLNGDAIKDLLLFTEAGARGCNVYYEVMLFEKQTKSLHLLRHSSPNQLSDPGYDAKRKWIVSNNCSSVSFEHYYFVRHDSLKLVGWTTIEMEGDDWQKPYTHVYYSFGRKELHWRIKGGNFEQASNLIYKTYLKRK